MEYRDYCSESLGFSDAGNFAKAIEWATKGIEEAPQSELLYGPQKVELYSLRGTYYEFNCNYDNAIRDTAHALQIYQALGDNDNAVSKLMYLAYLYSSAEQYQQAIETIDRAIMLISTVTLRNNANAELYRETLRSRAVFYKQKGDVTAAREHLRALRNEFADDESVVNFADRHLAELDSTQDSN